MKNLKRALSFAVAAVMLVGMMAVGTSAFTDDEKIVNDAAVNVMNQLNIINGKPDGSFDPEATVSRGEMAKMICVALNGGKAPVLDTAVSTYPDTVGHWAAGYIEYCSSLGIVAGSTDGNFYPNAPITGTEAAKMVLIALGYVAENEGFVNNKDWSTNINVVANKKGLYEDVTSLPGAPISRDNAAQMLYNGLQADAVAYQYQLNTVNGDLVSVAVAYDKSTNGSTSILTAKFGLQFGTADLTDVAYDAEEEEYTYTFANKDDMGDTGLNKGTVDYSELFGQNVTVLWKAVDGAANDKLYGMYGNGSVMAEGSYGDIGSYDADEEGTEFGDGYVASVENLTYVNYLDPNARVNAQGAYAVKVLDKDGDDLADTVVVYPFEVAKVGFVGKTEVKVGNDYYKFDEHNIYTGIAKDDWAQVAPAANTLEGDKATITKLAAVTGTVEAEKNGEYKIDGAWYTLMNNVSVALNTEYDLIIIGSYVYDATAVEEEQSLTELVYVLNVDPAAAAGTLNAGTQKVKVMFTDGTTAIITVDEINDADVVAEEGETQNVVAQYGLYTYATKDGNYQLTTFDTSDYIVGGLVDDQNPTTVNADEGKFTTSTSAIYRLNDDAILFVTDGEGEVSVVKAADANKWKDTVVGTLYGETKNGFVYAQLGVLTTTGLTADSDAMYALVVDDYYKVKVDTDVYYKVSVWNGTENVELTVDDTPANAAKIAKGQLISYTVDSDDVATVAKVGTQAAVTAYNGTVIAVNSDEVEFEDEAVMLYVDSEKVVGVEGGVISIADKLENGSYVPNVYTVDADADGKIDVMVVEVNNKWSGDVFGA